MFTSIFQAILTGGLILLGGIAIILWINLIIQKRRAKKWWKEGYISATEKCIRIKKTEDGKIIIEGYEKPRIDF